MDANTVKRKVEEAWQDASFYWKDEYASRYQLAVISELENTLDQMQKTTLQLNDVILFVLLNLREFED